MNDKPTGPVTYASRTDEILRQAEAIIARKKKSKFDMFTDGLARGLGSSAAILTAMWVVSWWVPDIWWRIAIATQVMLTGTAFIGPH